MSGFFSLEIDFGLFSHFICSFSWWISLFSLLNVWQLAPPINYLTCEFPLVSILNNFRPEDSYLSFAVKATFVNNSRKGQMLSWCLIWNVLLLSYNGFWTVLSPFPLNCYSHMVSLWIPKLCTWCVQVYVFVPLTGFSITNLVLVKTRIYNICLHSTGCEADYMLSIHLNSTFFLMLKLKSCGFVCDNND